MKFVIHLVALVAVQFVAENAIANPVEPTPDVAPTASSAPNHAEPASHDVIAEARRWLGARNMTGKPGPWCASFANYILTRTGRQPLASDQVSAAFSYGPRLRDPKVGALAVVSTSYGRAGHIGFVSAVEADGSIRLISGNWGRRVGDAKFSRRAVVAFVDVP